VAEQESVEVMGELPNVTLVGVVQVRPDGDEAETEKFTVPVNPFRAVTAIVDVPEAPARIWLGETGPAEMEKPSGTVATWNVMFAVM